MSFGKNIYKLRKERGWTQAELADRLGVTNQAVSKWETGESLPDSALLMPLSELFGTTIDELFKGSPAANDSNAKAENRAAEDCSAGNYSAENRSGEVGGAKEDKDELISDKPNEWRSRFAVLLSVGLCLIFAGILAIILFGAFAEHLAEYGLVLMFAFFAAGVAIIVYAGIKDSLYFLNVKSEEWKPVIAAFAKGISIGVALCILAAAAFVFGMTMKGSADGSLIMLASVIIGFVFVAAAVTLFIIFGLRFGSAARKYAPAYIEERNGSHGGAGRFGGVVMLVATGIFLAIGFIWGKWHPAWVAFPIGGLICAILGAIDEATGKKK